MTPRKAIFFQFIPPSHFKHFRERTDEEDYVNVMKDEGCSSKVGKIYWGGGQDLRLSSDCIENENGGSVVHEFIHAWGFYHEHTRPDRDKYVKVHRENVMDGKWKNFKKQEDSCTFGVPYDGNSIMHYSSKAWLKPNLPEGSMTIESLVKFENKVFFIYMVAPKE